MSGVVFHSYSRGYGLFAAAPAVMFTVDDTFTVPALFVSWA